MLSTQSVYLLVISQSKTHVASQLKPKQPHCTQRFVVQGKAQYEPIFVQLRCFFAGYELAQFQGPLARIVHLRRVWHLLAFQN